jgi:two-component system chemotaxis response regulator CheB
VVDDSLVVRKVLRDCLAEVSDVEVVAIAGDGMAALEKIRQLKPDFITLDVDMPVMNGLELLQRLRADGSDVDVLMVSALTAEGAESTIRALSMGALDVLLKPTEVDPRKSREQLSIQLHDRVAMITTKRSRRAVTQAPARHGARATPPVASVRQPTLSALTARTLRPVSGYSSRGDTRLAAAVETIDSRITPPTNRLADVPIAKAFADAIAIGISTGGPAALQKLLPRIPESIGVPIVIVQHMPRTFTASLARDLDSRCPLKIREAVDGDPLVPGVIYIAPAGYQTKAVRRRGAPVLEVNDDAPVRSCKPSVDYLFRSFAAEYGSKSLGIVMTGMGNDGTEGAKFIRDAGGHVIAQDEASCTIYGMPKAVLEAGRVSQVMSLDELPAAILRAAKTVVTLADSVKG